MSTDSGVGYADITNLVQGFAQAGESMPAAAARVVHEATMATEHYAQAYAPVKTGRLRASISGYSDGLTGVVSASAPYALFVELGTGTRGEFPSGPITIRPKNGQYLSWIGGDGKRVFARQVTSPGMHSRPYLRPALEQAIGELADQLGLAGVVSIVQGVSS